MNLRSYQTPIFNDNTTPVLGLHWARQTGKSTVLAAWAVDRLLTRPGRLVTVLTACEHSAAKFAAQCQAACADRAALCEMVTICTLPDPSATQIRIKIDGRPGCIQIQPASADAARGFSGDVILDEFALHRDADAIWEAVQPIVASNQDFLCRIASTGNGRNNLFHRLVTAGQIPFSRVSLTDAWKAGRKIFDAVTRAEITPDEARSRAQDKAVYDQNYELTFLDDTALAIH